LETVSESLSWSSTLRSAFRSLPRSSGSAVASSRLLCGAGALFVFSAAAGWFLKTFGALETPAQPYHQILASIGLNILLLGIWLALLPAEPLPWARLRAWLQGAGLAAAAFAGLYLCGKEPAHTFVALWLLTVAQGALLCGIGAVAALIFGCRAPARQILMVLLMLATTAVFWTKTPIQTAPVLPDGTKIGERYTDAVLKLSPPMAVSSAWFQESAAARTETRREGSRFEIVHGPRTYNIWVGSAAGPYPSIYPRTRETFQPGLVLSLLLWGLPLILVCDLLLFVKERRA